MQHGGSDDVNDVIVTSPRTFLVTYIVTGITQGCMFIYLGTLPYIFNDYGVDAVSFGYVISASAFLTLCSSPILGRVGDVMGSRTVFILCMMSSAAAHFTMAIATNVPMLVISRLLGLLMDCMAAAQMTVTDLASEADRGRYLGKIMIPMSAAMIVAPTMGGYLSKYFGHQRMLMITWILPLICIFITLTFIPHRTKVSKDKADKQTGISWRGLGRLLVHGDVPFLLTMRLLSTLPAILFIINFNIAGLTYFKLTPEGNGLLGSAIGIMNMVINWYILGLLDKYMTPHQILKMASVTSIFTYFLLSLTTEIWELTVMMFFLVLSYSILDNQIMTRLTRSVHAKDTSTMVGIGTSLYHASRTISPTLGGVMMHYYGFPSIGATGAVVSILMTTLVFLKKESKTAKIS